MKTKILSTLMVAAMVAFAIPAVAQDVIPETDVAPAVPVQVDPLVAAFQLVLDSRQVHGERGIADLTAAQADEADRLEAYEAARQHTADVQAMVDTSAQTIVGHARAAVAALESLIEQLTAGP